MECPFILWTMRRTGGTSLASLLMECSPFPSCQHEPFNWDRKFGYISQISNYHRLRKKLKNDVLKNFFLIKHCYEIHGAKFSKVLLEESSRLGYKHIFLYRHHEFDRLMSLMVAKQTGIWGKEHGSSYYYDRVMSGAIQMDNIEIGNLKKEHQNSIVKTKEILEVFQNASTIPHFVKYDSLYNGSSTINVDVWRSLFNFIGLSYEEEFAQKQEVFNQYIIKSSQKTNSIYEFVPNWASLTTLKTSFDHEFMDLVINYHR